MQLLSLVAGGLVVGTLGIQSLYRGGSVLPLAGVLGLTLLGCHNFRRAATVV